MGIYGMIICSFVLVLQGNSLMGIDVLSVVEGRNGSQVLDVDVERELLI